MPKVNYWYIEVCKLAFPNRRCQSKIWLLVVLSLFVVHPRPIADPSCVYLHGFLEMLDVSYPWLLFYGSLGSNAFRQYGLRLTEKHHILGSLLLSGWLYPFKKNFTKKYSVPTCERYLCFPEGKGFWWQFWATIKSSRVTVIHVMSFINWSINSHSAILPVWQLSICFK